MPRHRLQATQLEPHGSCAVVLFSAPVAGGSLPWASVFLVGWFSKQNHLYFLFCFIKTCKQSGRDPAQLPIWGPGLVCSPRVGDPGRPLESCFQAPKSSILRLSPRPSWMAACLDGYREGAVRCPPRPSLDQGMWPRGLPVNVLCGVPLPQGVPLYRGLRAQGCNRRGRGGGGAADRRWGTVCRGKQVAGVVRYD